MKKFELLDYVLLFVVVILVTVAACLTKPSAERPGMKEAGTLLFAVSRRADSHRTGRGAD